MKIKSDLCVVRSPLTNRIYAGRSVAIKNSKQAARKFVGEKCDITDQALDAVAHYLVQTDDIKVFTLPDGREIHLRADVKEANQPHKGEKE